MEKEKKVINVLTVFFISHKSDVKTFLNWILNQCRAVLVNMTDDILLIRIAFLNLKFALVIQAGGACYQYHNGRHKESPSIENISFTDATHISMLNCYSF